MQLIQQVFADQGAIDKTIATTSLGVASLPDVFAVVTNIALGIGIALAVIFLIVGGIQYITSKGDQKAAETARKTLTNAVIGFIIVVGAFTIKAIVGGALGITGGTVTNVTPTETAN